MPFYRINGTMVHMRGTNLPAPCRASIGVLSIDGRPMPMQRCAAPSGFLCDGPADGGGTCDTPLCSAHAFEIGANKHLCPEHRQDSLDNQAQRGLFTSLL